MTDHTAMNDYFMASLDPPNVFTTSKFPPLFSIFGECYGIVSPRRSWTIDKTAGLLLSDLHSGLLGTTVVYLLPLLVLSILIADFHI